MPDYAALGKAFLAECRGDEPSAELDDALDQIAWLATTPGEWRVYVAALELARGPVERWSVTWQSMFYYWRDCGTSMVPLIRDDVTDSRRVGLFAAEWLTFVFAPHGVWIGMVLAHLLAERLDLPWGEHLSELELEVHDLGDDSEVDAALRKDRGDARATYVKILEPYRPEPFALASGPCIPAGTAPSGRCRWANPQRHPQSTGPIRSIQQAIASYLEILGEPHDESTQMLEYADVFVARNMGEVTAAIETIPDTRVAFLLLAQHIVDSAPGFSDSVPWHAIRPLLELKT